MPAAGCSAPSLPGSRTLSPALCSTRGLLSSWLDPRSNIRLRDERSGRTHPISQSIPTILGGPVRSKVSLLPLVVLMAVSIAFAGDKEKKEFNGGSTVDSGTFKVL